MAGLERGVRPVSVITVRERARHIGRLVAACLRYPIAVVGHRPRVTIGVLALLALALVGTSATSWVAAERTESINSAAEDATSSAKVAVGALLSYDFQSVSSAPKKQAKKMTGKFKAEYSNLVEKSLAPVAAKRELVTRTEVVSSSVVSEGSDRVVLLLFLNQVSQGKDSKSPVLSGSRVEVVMQRVAGDWRIAELKAV